MAMPFSSALRIESSSRTEPPGCTMAVTPYSAARLTQSSKGKKPSDASTSPSATPAALACLLFGGVLYLAALQAQGIHLRRLFRLR